MREQVSILKFPGFGPVRIAIADEESAFRQDLRRVLRHQCRIQIVGEAHDAESALAIMRRLAPQVLLLDYAVCRQLHARGEWDDPVTCPASVRQVVMLSAPEKPKIIDSFRLGAHGIVLKGSASQIWRRSILAVVAGQYWLGNESLAVLIQAIRDSPARGRKATAKHFSLTPREIEIVQKIAGGRSNKEVGNDFSIRERTVKHHLTNIFGKVGVSSRLELALFARDHEILPQPSDTSSPTVPETNELWIGAEKEPADGTPDTFQIGKPKALKSRASDE